MRRPRASWNYVWRCRSCGRACKGYTPEGEAGDAVQVLYPHRKPNGEACTNTRWDGYSQHADTIWDAEGNAGGAAAPGEAPPAPKAARTRGRRKPRPVVIPFPVDQVPDFLAYCEEHGHRCEPVGGPDLLKSHPGVRMYQVWASALECWLMGWKVATEHATDLLRSLRIGGGGARPIGDGKYVKLGGTYIRDARGEPRPPPPGRALPEHAGE